MPRYKTIGECPVCGRKDYLTRTEMGRRILLRIGYKGKGPQLPYGTFGVEEMRAVYFFVCGGKKNG